jgi:drug/metabolite transporter (DMT)-like permease
MRLTLITALVLVAFAANSILNRMAVGSGEIEAFLFAAIRALAGAVTLAILVLAQRKSLALSAPGRAIGAGSLALYLIGFSIAYIQIDAGVGALILFGGVQVTMFAGALISGDRPPAARWIGAGIALAGLAWLIWPTGAVALPVVATLAMLAAAVGWGIYSLAGRGARDPLVETAANFILATPLCALPLVLVQTAPASATGIGLAILAGAITSGLGYALWYSVLPALGASVAGLLQLSVPVIAALGGVLILSEALTLRLIGAGALVIGGIAFGLLAPQRTRGSKAS